jgi:uncharacterized protein
LNILLGIGHPADVHFFKYSIIDLKNKGHEVFIAAREKEITYYLLDKLNVKYHRISLHQKTIIKKLFDYFIRWTRTYKLCKKLKPDIAIGVGDFYLPQIGKLQGFKSIVITDTENVKHDSFLTFPFATHVLTPTCYKKDIEKKHIKYNSYKEMAYLHKKYFTPDLSIYDMLGIKTDERYIIIRFVSRTAVHDIGHKGLSTETKIKAAEEFSKHAKVFISSEQELPNELVPYKIPIPPEKIHHALYYANMFYGESSTMASESACLGTPAIYIDDVGRGYTDEEEERYGLLFNYNATVEDQEKSIQKGIELLQQLNLKKEWKEKREKMLEDKIDVTGFLVWFIENYPNSARIMKEDPDYQYRFKSADFADYAD